MSILVDPEQAMRESFARGLGTERTDPGEWLENRLKEETWSGQDAILESVRDNRRTAVKSSHGVGKSHIASRVAAWWLDTSPVGQAFVVSTAPTFPQVKAILWRYIGQAHRKGGLRGRCNQTEWYMGEELVGFGRKPSDYDDDAFQGIHAPKVLVIVDEACGIPAQLWVAIDSLITSDHCRILAIGNPDDPAAHFAKLFEPGSGWNCLTISAFDSPNFTDEEVSPELAASLVSQTWVDDAKRNWGEDSPLYTSKVLAEFPEDAKDSVVSASALSRCRIGEPEIDPDETDVQLGVDVGAGGDQSVIRERRGKASGRVWRSRHDDSMQLVGEIVQAINETGARRVAIDVIGIGWGVKGRLAEVLREREGPKVDVVGVNVGEASTQPKRFKNLRAELWWDIGRELTANEKWDLRSIDDQTAADLTAPKYYLDSKGRVQIESKDDLRTRIGRSPDDADSLLLAFYRGGRVETRMHKSNLGRSVRTGSPGRATAPR